MMEYRIDIDNLPLIPQYTPPIIIPADTTVVFIPISEEVPYAAVSIEADFSDGKQHIKFMDLTDQSTLGTIYVSEETHFGTPLSNFKHRFVNTTAAALERRVDIRIRFADSSIKFIRIPFVVLPTSEEGSTEDMRIVDARITDAPTKDSFVLWQSDDNDIIPSIVKSAK